MLTHFSLDKNGRHFPDDIFRCIFMNEKICALIEISLKFVPKGPLNNNPALASSHYLNQCWPDSLTHICSTRGRWVHYSQTNPPPMDRTWLCQVKYFIDRFKATGSYKCNNTNNCNKITCESIDKLQCVRTELEIGDFSLNHSNDITQSKMRFIQNHEH